MVNEKDTIELPKDNTYVESLDGNIEIEPYIVPDIRSFLKKKEMNSVVIIVGTKCKDLYFSIKGY